MRDPLDAPAADVGTEMHAFVRELFPLFRSLTGEGVRETLRRIAKRVELTIHEVPTGTPVFDWVVPREWNVRDAYVRGPDGTKVVDVADSNLHLVGYSAPTRAELSLDELKEHVVTLPEHPDWIPYRTGYYADTWGFCMRHRDLERLPEGRYEAVVDATLEDGSLTYGECLLPGTTEDEVLIHCHCCHPSLANDNLSGIAVATFLAQRMAGLPRRHSFRFVFAPGTIGALTWLARNADAVARIRHGLVVTCVGDPGPFTYKRTRRGSAPIDRAVEYVLRTSGAPHRVVDFEPWGYDERQYNAPGFDLPVGALMRTPNGGYPEYHTSADDLDLVRPEALAASLAAYADVVDVLERDVAYRNLSPYGEPNLGRRGLYPSIGGAPAKDRQLALLWVLNQSDGRHSLLDVAERSDLPLGLLSWAAERLVEHGLLAPIDGAERG